jgi:hypothetical protein
MLPSYFVGLNSRFVRKHSADFFNFLDFPHISSLIPRPITWGLDLPMLPGHPCSSLVWPRCIVLFLDLPIQMCFPSHVANTIPWIFWNMSLPSSPQMLIWLMGFWLGNFLVNFVALLLWSCHSVFFWKSEKYFINLTKLQVNRFYFLMIPFVLSMSIASLELLCTWYTSSDLS